MDTDASNPAPTPRRTFGLALAVAALAGLGAVPAHPAEPAALPQKGVQIIVPWPAGGSVDAMARAFAQALNQSLPQGAVVLNKDGAGGMIGLATLARAQPDGHTLAFGPVTTITHAAQLSQKPPISLDSFEYVCQVFSNGSAIVVPETSRFQSMKALMEELRARPDRVNYGHTGVGSMSHLSVENMLSQQPRKPNHVPYRGEAPLLLDLEALRLDFGVTTIAGAAKGGRPLRLLAVVAEKRNPAAPDVPSLKELGLPTLAPAQNGLLAPKGTPLPVLLALEQACQSASQAEVLRNTAHTLGQSVEYLGRADFSSSVAQDFAAKGQLIRRLRLSIE